MPGSRHAWPNSAACWSPAIPETGIPAGTPRPAAVTPNRPLDGRTSGRADAGTPKRSRSSSDHAIVRMSKSIVRLALDGSVASTPPSGPPVRFHSSHASMVPSARSGLSSTPPSVSSHSALVAEKYGSSTRPVVAPHGRLEALVSELVAARRGAPVLPHDGPVQRLAVATVPGDHRLALVGDADGGDGLVEPVGQLGERGLDRGPDLGGVVLHPARPGEVLGELAVREAGRGAVVAHGEGAHAGGAGIDGDHDGHRAENLGRRDRLGSPMGTAGGAHMRGRDAHRRR